MPWSDLSGGWTRAVYRSGFGERVDLCRRDADWRAGRCRRDREWCAMPRARDAACGRQLANPRRNTTTSRCGLSNQKAKRERRC